MPISEELKQMLTRPLGRIPSGVYILTCSHGGRSSAMLASWVQQASFDPPAVSIAVASGRPVAELIAASGRLAVSILADGGMELMKKYARGIAEGADPFEGVRTLPTPGGQMVLADALAWIEGEVISRCEFGGDHALLVARITAGASLKDGAPFIHVRKNGFGY